MNKKTAYIFHVGNMNNRGTQALITSDVASINQIFNNNADILISTSDISGVEKLNLPIKEITSTLIDIPFEKSDELLRKKGEVKRGNKYLLFSIFYFMQMFLQLFLINVSVLFIRIGLRPIYKSDILNKINSSDIIISCSDENYKEGSSLYSLNVFWMLTWWSLLFSRTVDVAVASMLKKPIVMFPNSVGPFQSSVGKLLAKLTFNKFSIVLLRESISYELVKNMKLNSNLVLSGDAALLYEVSSKSAENNKYNYSVMGISPGFYSHILSKREIENYIEIHARTIDYVIGKYGLHVHLLPHYVSGFENDDLEISKKIYGCVKNKEYVSIIITGSLHEFKEELNQLELHISSKMHPTILATSNFIPAISVAYDHKQIGFYKNLDIEGMIVDLKKLKYDDFVHEIDLAWSTRNQLESKLKEKVPMLQKRILNSMKYAIESYCL